MTVKIYTINPDGDEENMIERLDSMADLSSFIRQLKQAAYQVISWDVR